MSTQRSRRTNGSYLVGKIRPSQIITTFGPGAVVDLPEESVMIAGIDTWHRGHTIHELRLEKALNVEYFRAPSVKNNHGDIPAKRFPKRRVCSNPNCSLIGWKAVCVECKSKTYPARIIQICENGHADDFPWNWWVHGKDKCSGVPVLRLKSSGKTAALADLTVHCSTCSRHRSLSGALGKIGDRCSGLQPWLTGSPTSECTAEPRAVLRGASNVYFSSLLSALSIPPWNSPIQEALHDYWEALRHLPEQTLPLVIQSLPDLKDLNPELVLKAINERKAGTSTTRSIRVEEYLAFSTPARGRIGNSDFEIIAEDVPGKFKHLINQVVLAHRLREVRVLRGFTRINPPDPDDPFQKIAPIFAERQKWLPATENRGEGIFIQLALRQVETWEKREQVIHRVNALNNSYIQWRNQRGLPPLDALPRGRFYLIHTLGHLLMRQLALDCGYSSSSLRERVYANDEMCGLLIYTASADSDGSLGGLVQQGRKDRFGMILEALLENAQWCSSDPLCSEHDPDLTHHMNGAACHSCCLQSETSCEYGNRFLDRALVRDLINLENTGYFNI